MPTSPFLSPERDDRLRIGRAIASGGNTMYCLPGVVATAVATHNPANDADYFQPIYVQTPIIVDQLAMEVTTGEATNARIGLYAADVNWQPTSLIADSGDISISATGVKTYTPGTALYLPRGRYLTVRNVDGAGSASFRVVQGSVVGVNQMSALGTTPLFATNRNSRVYAAFPVTGDPWTTEGGSAIGINYGVFLRVSRP